MRALLSFVSFILGANVVFDLYKLSTNSANPIDLLTAMAFFVVIMWICLMEEKI